MKELEERISEIINDWTCSDESELTLDERNRSTELAKEIKDIATSFAEWIKKEGYIYAGEHDYMYPDANGLIGGDSLFKEFIEKYYENK